MKFPETATTDNYSTTKKFPYVFVADEAFALHPFMLQTFSWYRFRTFRRPIIAKIENTKHIIKAAVILHNFLMKRKERGTYCPPDYVDQEAVQRIIPGSWWVKANGVQGLTGLGIQESNNSTRIAKEVHNDFKDLFNSQQGELSWQNHIVQRTSDPFDEDS